MPWVGVPLKKAVIASTSVGVTAKKSFLRWKSITLHPGHIFQRNPTGLEGGTLAVLAAAPSA